MRKAERPGTAQLGEGNALEGILSVCENTWQEGVKTVKLGFFQGWPEAMAQNETLEVSPECQETPFNCEGDQELAQVD